MFTTAPIPSGLANPVEHAGTALLTRKDGCASCGYLEDIGYIYCTSCVEDAYSAAKQIGPAIRSGDLAYALGKREHGDGTPRPTFDGRTLTDAEAEAVAALVKGYLSGFCHRNNTPEAVQQNIHNRTLEDHARLTA